MRPTLLAATALLAVACSRQVPVGTSPAASQRATAIPIPIPIAILSADQLVDAMHARYAGKWYRTLTFVQTTRYLRPDGTPSRVETWYESAMIPGRLRIDLGDRAKGNGVLYRGDSVYQVQGGRVTQRMAGRNILMTLGFDVYAQPATTTLGQLRAERIDLTMLRMDTLYGRRVYVVGAGPADSTSTQFWVDAERMVFVRLIQSDDRRRTQDVRFERYVQHGGGWVAEEVRVLVGGRMVFQEEYANVRVNVPLDEGLFVPEKWATATHWFTP